MAGRDLEDTGRPGEQVTDEKPKGVSSNLSEGDFNSRRGAAYGFLVGRRIQRTAWSQGNLLTWKPSNPDLGGPEWQRDGFLVELQLKGDNYAEPLSLLIFIAGSDRTWLPGGGLFRPRAQPRPLRAWDLISDPGGESGVGKMGIVRLLRFC